MDFFFLEKLKSCGSTVHWPHYSENIIFIKQNYENFPGLCFVILYV